MAQQQLPPQPSMVIKPAIRNQSVITSNKAAQNTWDANSAKHSVGVGSNNVNDSGADEGPK